MISIFNLIKTKISKYQVYKNTIEELSSLSDKELKDLGISRFDIRNIAMEAYQNAR